MPFELYNISATFQRMINYIMNNHLDKFVIVYLDDILVFFKDIKSHIRYLKWIFQQLEKANLKFKLKKCEFKKKEIKYLKYKISEKEIRSDSNKIKIIN